MMRTVNIIKGGFRFVPLMYLRPALEAMNGMPPPIRPMKAPASHVIRMHSLVSGIRTAASEHNSDNP